MLFMGCLRIDTDVGKMGFTGCAAALQERGQRRRENHDSYCFFFLASDAKNVPARSIASVAGSGTGFDW